MPVKESQDSTIINLILKESKKDLGFRLLVSKYKERIYWHVRRMVGVHEDANDVCQEVFIKIYQNLDRFNGDAALYTWIYRISVNEALGFLRKKKQDSDDIDQAGIGRWAGDAYFDGDAAERKLWEAIYLLPPKQRAVFELKYFEEMPYREMSEILGTSEGSLKASYHHAVTKIEYYIKTS